MSAFQILLRKELLDLVRDTRAMVLNIVLPIFLYPGMIVVLGFIISAGQSRLDSTELKVATTEAALALLSKEPAPKLTSYLIQNREASLAQMKDKKVAAFVDAQTVGSQTVIEFLYTKRFDTSNEALVRLRPVIKKLNGDSLKLRLSERNLDDTFAEPVKLSERDVDFDKNMGPLLASRFLPLMLLTILLGGAVSLSVDLTAGEKERGTLETLLVSGAAPSQVMAAKLAVVGLMSVVTTLANLLALGGTLALGALLSPQLASVSLSVSQLLMLLLVLVPVALFMSAFCLAIASTAKTVKEGQVLMSPVMLLGMIPGMAAQMPGLELSWGTAFIPLVNAALLIKAMVLKSASFELVLASSFSLLVCAGLATILAGRAFNSEELRFASSGEAKGLLASLKAIARSKPSSGSNR
jgi:sodium transport system permease protein